MGLLDQLGNLSPEQAQGLLAAGFGMMGQSGPSPTPRNFGQIAGAGFGAYQNTIQALRQQKQDELERAQMMQMRGLQMKNMEGDIANQDLTRANAQKVREREERIRNRMVPQGAPSAGMPPAAATALGSMAPGGTGSPKTGGPDWMQAYQAQQPAAPQAPPAAQQGLRQQQIDRLTQEAQIRQQEGDIEGANRALAEAMKLMPEFGQTPQKGRGADGKPFNYVLDKDGNERRLNAAPLPDMGLMDQGGNVQAYDKDALQSGQIFAKTMTTGDKVSLANAAKVDARSRDANTIAAKGKVVDLSTGLRKEFEDLPEVKGYKMAVPAYKSVVDAAKRNSTQADINLVYGIAKLYDPTSVVREGEYATVAKSPNIPEKIKGHAQYLAGGGRLTDAVKKQIVTEAQGRMQSYEGEFTAARTNYEDIARRAGGDPSLVFPSPYKSPVKPPEKTVKRTGTINGRKVIEYSDGSVEYAN